LGLGNGNAFTEAETGEPPISRQNALECTKSHIKFEKFSGGNTPEPPSTGPQTLGKGGRERECGEGKGGRSREEGKGERREGERELGKENKFCPPPHFSDQSYDPADN